MATPTRTARQREPQVVMAKVYEVTLDGKKQRLTEPEYQPQFERARKKLILNLTLIRDEAAYNRVEHKKWMKQVHGSGVSVGAISDILGGVVPPLDAIWTRMDAPIASGLRLAEEGKLDVAARQLTLANQTLRDVKKEWNDYLQATIGGAAQAQAGLEVTRDISFAIAISAAAVVAAPIVVGAAGTALAGTGLTGAGLTAATFATSATAITVGGGVAGGVLRGGSNLAGQAVAGGPISAKQLKKETWEGVKHGAVDAGSTFVGGAVGEVLGVGAKGIGFATRVIRGAGAGVAGGAFGGGLGSTLEGHDAGQVLQDTLTGGASGISGALGAGVSHVIPNAPKLVQSLAGAGSGSLVAADTAYASGASSDEIKKAAITAGIQGFALSHATQGGVGFGEGGAELQQQVAEQRAAKAGATQTEKSPPPSPQQEQLEQHAKQQQDAQAQQQSSSEPSAQPPSAAHTDADLVAPASQEDVQPTAKVDAEAVPDSAADGVSQHGKIDETAAIKPDEKEIAQSIAQEEPVSEQPGSVATEALFGVPS